MKLNMFYGRTYYESFEKIINDLKKNYSHNENYLVIVPDRFTLFTEKYIMDKLDLTSTFNIDILTLNTLANRNCLINDYVDNETATMILSKVIFEIRDKLNVLKSTQSSFSEEMYALIQQIKSSRVDSKEFLNCEFTGTDYEKLKKQDIALIYSSYEDYLERTGIDAVKKFEIFIEEIKNIESVKNSYIYLVGFESFTCQGYAIIENLIKYSKGVKIATINRLDCQNNGHLYPCDISYEIKRICADLKIECVIDNSKLLKDDHIINNLWSAKPTKKLDYKVNVYEADSQVEEYRKIAELIWKNIIKNDLKFNDFNIIMNVSSEENQRYFSSILNDYKISHFLDSSKNLSNFMVIKFICQVNECVQKNFDRLSFIEYSKSPFVEGTREEKNNFENFANQYSIRYDEFYKENHIFKEKVQAYEGFFDYSSKIAKNILEYRQLFKMKDWITNYVRATKNMIQIFDLKNKFNEILQSYKDEEKILQLKFGEKVFERLDILLDNLDRVLGNTIVTFKEFVSIFQSGLFATKITIVPQSVDAVFVGDIKNSFFIPRKYNYFIDCENNLMPLILTDNGIFSDDDIKNSKTRYKIDPQITMLNKKIKLKNLSLLGMGNISIFYSVDNGKEPTKTIKDLEKICSIISYDCNDQGENDYYYLLGKNSSMEFLTKNYSDNIDIFGDILDNKSFEILTNITNKDTQLDYLTDSYNDLFFKDNNFSITQIETFYSCPYKHFLNYGLRLEQNLTSDLTKLELGNIIHDFCQNAIKYTATTEYEEVANKIFDEVINKDRYISIRNNQKNKNIIKGLRLECVKIFEALCYQLEHSQYTKHLPEKRFICKFDDLLKLYNLDTDDINLSFNGKIDRLDIDSKKDFIIIDYKTGITSNTNYKDIYYGRKLQSVAYAVAIESMENEKCVGYFYMPLENKLRDKYDNKFKKYKMKGMYLSDENIAKKIDKRVGDFYNNVQCAEDFESDIIDLKIDKQNHAIKSNDSNLTELQMDKVKIYVLNMIKQAIEEIKKGNIKISPTKSASNQVACDFCGYKSICKVNKYTKYRVCENITKSDFLGEYADSKEIPTNLEDEE